MGEEAEVLISMTLVGWPLLLMTYFRVRTREIYSSNGFADALLGGGIAFVLFMFLSLGMAVMGDRHYEQMEREREAKQAASAATSAEDAADRETTERSNARSVGVPKQAPRF